MYNNMYYTSYSRIVIRKMYVFFLSTLQQIRWVMGMTNNQSKSHIQTVNIFITLKKTNHTSSNDANKDNSQK